MAVTASKTWIAGEVLSAADLNAEFTNVYSNGEDLGWPATKAKDLDGQELILDSDGDTSITADTDDQVDVKIGGTDRLVMTATDIQYNGESLVQRGEIRRLGLHGMVSKVADVDGRVQALEHNSILESQVFS